MMNRKKILITGATGFIGNHLIEYLLKYNYEIIATGIENKTDIKRSWLDKVTYIQHDLNLPLDDPYSFFMQPDVLIHLSWQGLPNYKELFHFEKNLPNSYYFIKKLVLGGLKDVTVLGTCFEYGLLEGELNESMDVHPVTAYALAKDTLRKFLEEFKKHTSFDLKWVRLFYLYGEGQSKKSILELLKAAVQNKETVFNMSGGAQFRDYLPVERVAEYLAKITLQNNVQGIINCCSGNPVSMKTFVENYLKENHLEIKLNFGYYPYLDYEPMSFYGSTAKLNTILKESI